MYHLYLVSKKKHDWKIDQELFKIVAW